MTLQHAWTNGGLPRQVVLERLGSLDALPDVAAYRLPEGTLEGIVGEVPLTSKDLAYSQPVYILGYPYGLSFRLGVNGVPMPLVKRGIVSGSMPGDAGEEVHLLDVIANPGFSGGPAVFFPLGSRSPQIAGVVRGNLTGPLHEPTEDDPTPVRATAGISLATNSASVLALLA